MLLVRPTRCRANLAPSLADVEGAVESGSPGEDLRLTPARSAAWMSGRMSRAARTRWRRLSLQHNGSADSTLPAAVRQVAHDPSP